jgi:hypothetical protein
MDRTESIFRGLKILRRILYISNLQRRNPTFLIIIAVANVHATISRVQGLKLHSTKQCCTTPEPATVACCIRSNDDHLA